MGIVNIKDSVVIVPNKYVFIGGYLLRKFNVSRTEPTYEGWGKCGACSLISLSKSYKLRYCSMSAIDLNGTPRFLCISLGDLKEFRQMRYNDRGVFMNVKISLFLSALIIKRSGK